MSAPTVADIEKLRAEALAAFLLGCAKLGQAVRAFDAAEPQTIVGRLAGHEIEEHLRQHLHEADPDGDGKAGYMAERVNLGYFTRVKP